MKKENKKFNLSNIIKRLFSKKLTYEERIQWFVNQNYETGMEYEGMLISMKNENLDNFKWYDEFIKIPKYKYEV